MLHTRIYRCDRTKAKPQGSLAMSSILNALKEEDAPIIFNQLLQENKEFAFNTLDCIPPTTNLFTTLFSALDKNQYIEHVKAKHKGSLAMSGILNALKKEDAPIIFNQLPKEFAFNTLDYIDPQYTLFKTLFNQLNPKEKEEYRVHLKTKSTAKAKLVLKNFYLNNQESVNNLSTENSNEPLVQNRDDLPAAHFSPISRAFEETAVEYPFNTRPEFSSYKEDQSCSQTVILFPGFAEFHNQFRNTVTENLTVSSSLTSNENISDSLEGEQLSPEYYNYLINGVVDLQSSIVDDLPELTITPAFEETVVEHPFDSRPDFSYENEPLVHKRKRDDLNEFSDLQIEENFFSSSITLEQTIAEYEFDVSDQIPDFSHEVEPPAKRQCISVPPFEGFGELHNQFRNIVPENSTGSSSLTSNENISDSLESEVNSQSEPDSRVNEELSLTNLQLFIFDRPGDLEEINIDQPRRFQTTITSTRR